MILSTSVRVPQNYKSKLFGDGSDKGAGSKASAPSPAGLLSNDEATIESIRDFLGRMTDSSGSQFVITDIDGLATKLGCSKKMRTEGSFLFETYEFAYSKLLELPRQSSGFKTWKPVCVNTLAPHKSGPHSELRREILMCKADQTGVDYSAVFDLSLLIGYRRSYIFSPELSGRIFDLFLPPGELMEITSKVGEIPQSLSVVPVLTMVRKPTNWYFRRTLTMSLVLIPTYVRGEVREGVASLPVDKLHEFMSRKGQMGIEASPNTRYRFTGALRELTGSDEISLDELMISLQTLLFQTVSALSPESAPEVRSRILSSVSNSWTSAAMCLLPPDVKKGQTAAAWIENPQKESDFDALIGSFVMAGYPTGLGNNALDLRSIMLNSRNLPETGVLHFFNPMTSSYFALFDEGRENFPEESGKWIVGWIFFINAAVASLREMLQGFYHETNQMDSLESVEATWGELLEDFDEFYDLDIARYTYREQYERLRSVASLTSLHEALKGKFEAVKDKAYSSEQTNELKKIDALTAGSADLNTSVYRLTFFLAILASATLGLAGFTAFSSISGFAPFGLAFVVITTGVPPLIFWVMISPRKKPKKQED